MTFHPNDANFEEMSPTLICSSTKLSFWILFLSTMAVMLLTSRCVVAIAASHTWPSWISPSPSSTHVWRSDRSSLAASADPKPNESPIPRLPAEKSTPLVHFLSTCPWQTDPIDLNPSKSESLRTSRSLRMEYTAGLACPLLMMNRSLSPQSGFPGSNLMTPR